MHALPPITLNIIIIIQVTSLEASKDEVDQHKRPDIIQISLPFYLSTRLQGGPPIQDDMMEQES